MNAFLDARMDPLIENHRVVALAKRTEERVIGHETATHEERLLDAEKPRPEVFQTRMRRMMPAQKPRAARAEHAVAFESRNRRFAQRRMTREPQIIV